MSSGCSGRDRDIIAGRLLAFNDTDVFGYGRTTVHWSNQLEDGPYRLFAVPRGGRKVTWSKPIPLAVRSLLLADKVLFVAGDPLAADGSPAGGDDPAGMLMAVAAADGTVLGRCPLDGVPAWDALAASAGRLYLSLTNGQLVCLEADK